MTRLLDRYLLRAMAVAEALTAAALMARPDAVVRLLFAGTLDGVGVAAGRVAGMALLGLSIACWPRSAARFAHAAMLAYSSLVAIYFVILGAEGRMVGELLWPAAITHALLSVLLAWSCRRRSPAPSPL